MSAKIDLKDFQQIVISNNHYKLDQTLRILDSGDINDYLTTSSDVILFLINTICMANDEARLQNLLETIARSQITFKFNHEFLYYLIRENNLSLVRAIIQFAQKHTNQDFMAEKIGEYFNPKHNETTLLKAVKKQNFDLVKCLIQECGASVNSTDLQQRTPVYIAAGLESLEILEFLEQQEGADLNKVCANGDTPLQRACMLINVRNMEFLINKGVDVNFKGYAGNAPIHLARQRLDALQLILKSGGDLTLKNDAGYSCFVRSCCVDNLDIMQFIHGEMLSKFGKDSDFMREEIINACVGAIINLKIKNLEYLIRFVESKKALNSRLKEILDLDACSSHLSFYAKMNEVNEKKIIRFHELFMILIKHDLHPYPDQPLFYQHKFIELLSVNFLNKILQYEALEETKQKFVNCLYLQLQTMQAYGRLNVFRSGYGDLVNTFQGLVDLGVIIQAIFEVLRAETSCKNITLVTLCRNKVRFSIQGMSERQIECLNLPKHLKAFLF